MYQDLWTGRFRWRLCGQSVGSNRRQGLFDRGSQSRSTRLPSAIHFAGTTSFEQLPRTWSVYRHGFDNLGLSMLTLWEVWCWPLLTPIWAVLCCPDSAYAVANPRSKRIPLPWHAADSARREMDRDDVCHCGLCRPWKGLRAALCPAQGFVFYRYVQVPAVLWMPYYGGESGDC